MGELEEKVKIWAKEVKGEIRRGVLPIVKYITSKGLEADIYFDYNILLSNMSEDEADEIMANVSTDIDGYYKGLESHAGGGVWSNITKATGLQQYPQCGKHTCIKQVEGYQQKQN